MTKQYRALIAAPPGLMRRSLRAVLTTFPTVSLIGEADGCLTAQQMTQTLKPDILLIAAGLPEREVVMLLEGFQDKDQYRPKTIVFVNTSQQKMQATAAGADAVLLQSAPTHQLASILTHFQTTPSPLTQS